MRKSKTPIFERGLHKNVLGRVLTIFQTSPSGSGNHKSHDKFYFISSMPGKLFFMALRSNFLKFSDNYIKNTA